MAFPFYKQADSMDCGPTCLKMVAKYYGSSISSETLRAKTQVGKEGVSLLGILEAAESIGFRTRPVKIDYVTLTNEARLPAILHWNQNHFVVLCEVNKNKLLVADPAKGLFKYTKDEFKSFWINDKTLGNPEGIALLLEPSPIFYENRDDLEEKKYKGLGFRNMLAYLFPYKNLILQLFIGLGVASLLQFIFPFLSKSVVDVGINTGNLHFIYIVLFAQLMLLAGKLIIDLVRGWILLFISTRINVSILTDFLIKLFRLPVSFFDNRKTGDILQRMNDHVRIETFLTGSSLTVLFSMINLLVFSIVLAMFNTYIFVVFIIATFLYTVWVALFLKKRKELDYKRFDVASKERSATIQMVQGMHDIKLNGIEKTIRWSWERLQAKLFNLSVRGMKLNQWQQTGAFFINEGKNLFVTFLCANAVIHGQMSIGTLIAVQFIIIQLNSPVEQLTGFIQNWQNARISMDRLNEIHCIEDEEPEHQSFIRELPAAFSQRLTGGRSAIEVPVDSNASICFNNISFTYPGFDNEAVLKDINLEIPLGKRTAIVGFSGSGKSTLLKLLLKFYEPQKGNIKVFGLPLANVSHKFWRSCWGGVMQESFIFSDTIASNIAIGDDMPDMARLHHAAQQACIREFIESLPLGFNTRIGAEGTGLSMGQKQRILIARAIFRNPDFIFFDEATNSLDANNESNILQNLELFFAGKTVLVIAHRLSTVKHADQIIVLDKGAISERGTHRELINQKGAYFSLIKNQLEFGI